VFRNASDPSSSRQPVLYLAPCRVEDIQGQCKCQQHKGQSEDVRVVVAEQKGKERELGDHFLGGAGKVAIVYDPRGTPPPPHVVRVPARTGCGGAEVADIEPAEKRLAAPAPRAHQFQHTLEIAYYRHQGGSQQAIAGRAARPAIAMLPPTGHQVIDQ
jgi:hypothetical protein